MSSTNSWYLVLVDVLLDEPKVWLLGKDMVGVKVVPGEINQTFDFSVRIVCVSWVA